jgi:putative MATE family efflux protein
VGHLALPWILDALIHLPDVREAARSYLNWRMWGITSMVLTFSFKSFFDGIGKTQVHMWSAVSMNVINILLCMVLIFGRFGFPHLGMEGAGIAAFISTWIGLFIMVGWACLPHYRITYRPFRSASYERGLIWDILKLSIPSAVATIAVMSGFAMFAAIVSHLDKMSHAQTVVVDNHAEAVNSAATTLIVGILKLTFTACLAFGTATATLVGQSLGEGNPKKAAHFGWVSVRLGLLLFGLVGFLEGVVFPESILDFVSNSETVKAAALAPMRLMGLCTPLIAVGMILTQALFGAGNSVFVMIVELVLHFTCLVPLAWILGITLGFGLIGIWSAAAIYAFLLTTVMVIKFSGGSWQNIRI